MLKKIIFTGIGVAIVIGAIVAAKLGQFTAMGEMAENMVLPPETVTAMTVARGQWEQVIGATATVSAVQGVTIGAEAGGRVSEIAFESGTSVNEGDVLLRLDTASENAQLASAKAKETVAQVGVIRAQIAKKTVCAPFSGRLGLRQVNLGQILQEGDSIVTLQTPDPVHVDFSVPQQQIMHLQNGMLVRVTSDTAPGETFEGHIIAVSPEVDEATRNVRVRALVENSREFLGAGMFARVDVVLPDTQDVLPVVATAVLYATYGDSVFVIENHEDEQTGETEQVLRQQFVRLGRAYGDFVDVTDGLEVGDTVVTSGVFKLSSGMKVVIDNTLAPEPSLTPAPADS